MGCEGWSSADCWPLIARLETNDGPGEHHGRSGPVNIRTVPPERPVRRRDARGGGAGGPADVAASTRADTVTNGAGWFQINSAADNTRMSSSHAYLHPIIGSRPNLEVRTGCWVKRVALDECAARDRRRVPDARTCSPRRRVRARREVILSAGAIDTPKLLMLSGIGPGEHLQEFGIETLVDSPGVGANLDDHVEGIVQWDAKQPMIRTSTQWWEIGLFSTSEEGLDRPDLMMHYGSVPVRHEHRALGLPDDRERLLPDAERVPRTLARHGAAALARLPRPRARRPALLHRSRWPRRAGDDVSGSGWRARSSTSRRWRPGPAASWRPDPTRRPTTSWSTTCTRPTTRSTTRPARPTWGRTPIRWPWSTRGCACAASRALRIADGSILPFLPAINPCITTMMIGEKCARHAQGGRASRAPSAVGAAGDRLSQALRRRRPTSLASSAPTRRSTRSTRPTSSASPRRPRSSSIAPGRRSSPRAPGPVEHLRVVRSGAVEIVHRRPRARPARRGRAVRPRLDALRPADRLRGAGRRGHALLPDRRRRRPRAAGRPRRRCGSSRARCSSSADLSRPVAPRRRRRDPAHQPVGALIRGRAGALRTRHADPRGGADDERGAGVGRDRRARRMERSGSSPTATCARGSSPEGCRATRPYRRRCRRPPTRCGPTGSAARSLLEMLDRGFRHFPVVSPRRGEILGVVEDLDLVAVQTRSSFFLRRRIAAAQTVEELVERRTRAPPDGRRDARRPRRGVEHHGASTRSSSTR